MRVLILIAVLLIQGCESEPDCYELSDGTGRTGVLVGWDGHYRIIRMDDTGNLESHSYTAKIKCKKKDK